MAKYIEEKFTFCKKCDRVTRHYRNNSKSSGFAILVHCVLALCTAGLWLVPLFIYKILFVKIGGFKCSEH